jgi:hypothetical protein
LLPQTREEDAVSIDAAIAMRATFTQDSRAVRFAGGPADWRRAEALDRVDRDVGRAREELTPMFVALQRLPCAIAAASNASNRALNSGSRVDGGRARHRLAQSAVVAQSVLD